MRKIYPLGMILTMVILAKLAGEDKPSGIAQWIRLRGDAFVRIFRCKQKGVVEGLIFMLFFYLRGLFPTTESCRHI